MKKAEEKILEAAARLFARFGFKKTSVDEIAVEAGIVKSTLYQHFRSKDDILLAVVVRQAREARALALAQVARIEDPLDRLRALAELGWDFLRERPLLATMISDPAVPLSKVLRSDLVALAEGEMMGILQKIIEEGQALGRIRKTDARTMAYLFMKVFQSFTFARTGSLPITEERRAQEKKEVLDLLTRGAASG
ncbi:MAG: helix-turn-helix domain-containing protein [Thermodesulfobacteriota bacterium]